MLILIIQLYMDHNIESNGVENKTLKMKTFQSTILIGYTYAKKQQRKHLAG